MHASCQVLPQLLIPAAFYSQRARAGGCAVAHEFTRVFVRRDSQRRRCCKGKRYCRYRVVGLDVRAGLLGVAGRVGMAEPPGSAACKHANKVWGHKRGAQPAAQKCSRARAPHSALPQCLGPGPCAEWPRLSTSPACSTCVSRGTVTISASLSPHHCPHLAVTHTPSQQPRLQHKSEAVRLHAPGLLARAHGSWRKGGQ
jgi:hypothetical protein